MPIAFELRCSDTQRHAAETAVFAEIKVFGTQEERAPRDRFQRAAEQFLRRGDRDCTIHRGAILGAPHWEFAYWCRAKR